MTFDQLGLSSDIVNALKAKGFEQPTPIQAQTIPLMLSDDRDIMGQAQTGTGKTAAFGIPILEMLQPNSDHIQALVLTPTRELTVQVTTELLSLMGEKKLKITSVYGGQSLVKQKEQLRKSPDIVVGTPGRIIDHLKGKSLNLSQIQYLVLDEADEMLTGGFVEELETILSKANPDRKTLLFSATMPKPISKLAQKYMKETITVTAKKETLATTLTEQVFFQVRETDKLEALCRIIDVEEDFYGLIFCRTKRDVDRVTEKLIARGYDAEAMHGDLSQAQRERVLSKFRNKHITILVVTDVASRGLDISGLSHVINYALPQDAESYVHRVGRTGRAGKSGKAISFVAPSESRKFTYIQRVAQTEIKKGTMPTVQTIIANKKARIKQSVFKAIEQGIGSEFNVFAEELLEAFGPKDALAGILKIAYGTDFSETSYQSLTEVKGFDNRKGGGGDRDRGGRRRENRYGRDPFRGKPGKGKPNRDSRKKRNRS